MDKNLLNIERIKECIQKEKIYWTEHCLNKINKRNILIADVKESINNGRIIEYYYDDYPYESCLILGYDLKGKILHIVCGINSNFVYIITAYYPDETRWKDDMQTRRKK